VSVVREQLYRMWPWLILAAVLLMAACQQPGTNAAPGGY